MPTMATPMAGLGCIGRTNEPDRHTSALGFVDHILSQLVERPTVVVVALRLAHLGALSDARQIFQGNLTLSGVEGRPRGLIW